MPRVSTWSYGIGCKHLNISYNSRMVPLPGHRNCRHEDLDLSERSHHSYHHIWSERNWTGQCLSSVQISNELWDLLYPPSERSETGGYTVLLAFPSVRPSLCTHSYLDANISKTVWDRRLVPITTNRKWPMADRMMTSSMTSRDRERPKSWSQYL